MYYEPAEWRDSDYSIALKGLSDTPVYEAERDGYAYSLYACEDVFLCVVSDIPEALKAVIDWLFTDYDLDFLICGHFDFNRQSAMVQEKCGFRPYRKLVMDTKMGTQEPGVLTLLLNPQKSIHLVFSHPETLIWTEE